MRLTYLRCFPVHGELEALLLGLEVLVQLASPVTHHTDVQAQLVGLFIIVMLVILPFEVIL